MPNKILRQKILAVVEVLLVTFIIVPFLTLGVYRLFPDFENWQTQVLQFPFPVFINIMMVFIPVVVILLQGKSIAAFGIHLQNVRFQFDIALTCFIPFALSNFPLGMGVNYKTGNGALIMAAVEIGLLFLLGWILRNKPSPLTLGTAAFIFIFQESTITPEVNVSVVLKAISIFLTYALFTGFGEEILYRGYMQSRLNEVFGRPYQFFGVKFGWGAVITALLFGLTHIGILRWILGISTEVTLAWGFWTFFAGLAFGFIREKSGGILASALLHGLPQAISSVIILFL